ncbi:MAG: VWA domain-containing protein, partial [Pseudomonadota bacterium]
MFLPFFQALRDHKVPASLREFLTFLEALAAGMATYDVDAFYFLARATLVKDERHIDRFDQAFARSFSGIEAIELSDVVQALDLPETWLRKLAEKTLSAEEKAEIDSLGGFQNLMDTLKERLKDQKDRHQGGNKWIGTAGTSPFGAYGYNPEGVRIGQDQSRHQRAVKVWDKRDFRDFDGSVELGTRNIKVALKRLRSWARHGAADELD